MPQQSHKQQNNQNILQQLGSLSLWPHFIKFCTIPRPSKHEAAIINYIRQQGEQHDAIVEQDTIGNLLLRVPASQGYEKIPTIALQSHVDMVAQANSQSAHNFYKDPLTLQIKNGWLSAIETTLGADNGIGCAAMLALMTDNNVKHGSLELLFTVDEEAGMGGAFGLQKDWLTAKKLLNLDTEEEGEIYIGCAGGVDIDSIQSPIWQSPPDAKEDKEKPAAITISLTGLLGGHSGVDIHLKRLNANILLAQELLNAAQYHHFQLHSFNGGTLRNAIPREAFATIFSYDSRALIAYLETRCSELKARYYHSEPDLQLKTKLLASEKIESNHVLSSIDTQTLLSLLASHPNGVIHYSDTLEGVVESSNNLGIVTLNSGGTLSLASLCRSASNNERDTHANRIASYQKQHRLNSQSEKALEINIHGAYPGWQLANDNALMKQGLQLYQRLFNKEASLQVIHAGLECGLISETYPDCDIISFGPTITGAHSPNEQVDIKSVAKFWQFLTHFIILNKSVEP